MHLGLKKVLILHKICFALVSHVIYRNIIRDRGDECDLKLGLGLGNPIAPLSWTKIHGLAMSCLRLLLI